MAQRYTMPFTQWVAPGGAPLPGARLNFYVTGSPTPLDTYSDIGLTIPNTNPVVADGDGTFGNIFLQPQTYRVVLEDEDENEIWTADNVAGSGISGQSPIYSVSSIAALAALDTTTIANNQTFEVLGYANPGDGGGDVFYWNSSSAATGNGATIVTPASNPGTGRWFRNNAFLPKPEWWGAIPAGGLFLDGAINSASATFTSASTTFTSADVGKTIVVAGAGAAGDVLNTTISSFSSAHVVVLNTVAGTTVTNAHGGYGTNNTTPLASFFTYILRGSGQLTPGKVYLTTAGITSQAKRLWANGAVILFAIANHTSNCFTVNPPFAMGVGQVESRCYYDNLSLHGGTTGLDLLLMRDGSPIFTGSLTLDNSYRDSIMMQPRVTSSEAMENFTASGLIIRNSGRHGIHAYLMGDGSGTTVFINDTNIHEFEIRTLGMRFAGANAIRFTYDNIKVASQAKIGHWAMTGVSWDADQGNSLGGNSIGDAIYHDAINGTDWRRVEEFTLDACGVESTSGVFPNKKILNGSNFTAGDWIISSIGPCVLYNWCIGVVDAYLSAIFDGNAYLETSPNRSFVPLAIMKRPTTAIALDTAASEASPNGGLISSNFKNGPTFFAKSGTLVASASINLDIPLKSLSAGGTDYIQYPVTVILNHIAYLNDATYRSYGEWSVLPTYQLAGGLSFAHVLLKYSDGGAHAVFTFIPANVTFSIVTNNTLRVTIPGGANVGTAGSVANIDMIASRFGMLMYEGNRIDFTSTQVNMTI